MTSKSYRSLCDQLKRVFGRFSVRPGARHPEWRSAWKPTRCPGGQPVRRGSSSSSGSACRSRPSPPADRPDPASRRRRWGGGGGGACDVLVPVRPAAAKIREDTVKQFNASSKTADQLHEFQNDAYKTKIKTAIGAGKAPTIIWGWGGGGLSSYVHDNKVEDLTSWFDQNPDVKNRLFPSSFGAATVDGKIYAMPCETVQPIILLWNKKVFDEAGAEPPEVVGRHHEPGPEVQRQEHRADLARPVSRCWTNMMWLEFLFDRIGGRTSSGGLQRREERVVQPGGRSRR